MNKTPGKPSHRHEATRRGHEFVLFLVVAAIVLLTWQVSRAGYFTSGSDLGYWLGVAGGTMMLLLLTYPLRKHFRFMNRLGAIKYWFAAHMFLGVAGPVLILLHSTYRIGSLNAAIALTCMLVVAVSGIVGRFIYTRIHHGLYGELEDLKDLQDKARFESTHAQSRLHFVPNVEQRLQTFEQHAIQSRRALLFGIWQCFALPVYARWTYWQCERELRLVLRKIASQRGWSRPKKLRRTAHATRLVKVYLDSIQNVAQFVTYERLFSLWHVLHVPFVYMLIASAIAHVVAVHMY